MNFLDLFAGAGGLSEGFTRAGFSPVAHIEMDQAACYTLRTRAAYHRLQQNDMMPLYSRYLSGCISRTEFYSCFPENTFSNIINQEISKSTLRGIFRQIDVLLCGNKLDLIVGGPPCQAYSLIGRSRDKNRMLGDKRNYLYAYYAEFLKRYKPKFFVFENVTGLLSARDSDGAKIFDNMIGLFNGAGYTVEYKIVAAEEHGVLQKRRRLILIGRRGRKTGFFPELNKWRQTGSLNDVFSDLPFLKSGQGTPFGVQKETCISAWQQKAKIVSEQLPLTWHQTRPHIEQDLEIYRLAVELWNDCKQRLDYNSLPDKLKTHNNRQSFLDRFKVVAVDLPYSHTVVAHIARDGHYYIHPDIRQNRSISVREAARLQTFPDDYFFESVSGKPSRTAAFRQIGNAVPVLLAEQIAEKVKEYLG